MSPFNVLHNKSYTYCYMQICNIKNIFGNILGVQNKKYFSDLAVEMYEFLESDIQHNELRFEERNGLLLT